jgi:putative ABC transport system permease protein
VKAAAGRLIDRHDDQLGNAGAAVAVLSWAYWDSRFNLDPAVLGRRIVLDGAPVTVIGVTPREFFGVQVGLRSDVWVPAAMEAVIRRPSQRADGSMGIALLGRLKPGVSIEEARAEMRLLNRRRIDEIAAASHDPLWRQATLDVEPAATGFSVLRDRFGQALLVLMAIVGLLLLIACSNVASLLLARGTARRREMAVRVALGAGRFRLVRQVLTESLTLSVAGGLLGIFVAYVGADVLLRIIASGRQIPGWNAPIEVHLHPDAHVLLFTATIAVLTGLLFGLAPAWNAFASAPASSLHEIGTTGEARSGRFLGNSLVVGQIALSVVLLTGAGLFVGRLSTLRNVDLGFRRDSVLLLTLNPQGSGYNRVQLTRLYRDLLVRLQAIPGVRSVSLSGTTPIEGGAASRFGTAEGFQERPEDRRYLMLNWVSPRYFETFGTPLVAGRDFAFEDETRSRVAIVNQAMARHYFGDSSPIGKHVRFDGDEKPYEIVGVAADAKYADLHDAAPRTVYLNAFQEGGIGLQFALRTNVAPTAIAGSVRRVLDDTLKTVHVAKMTTLAEQVDASIVPERLVAVLSGFFGGLAALLAAIGLYGLLAYTVARRINEIGIRIALGATRRDVMVMVLKTTLGLAGAGLLVGVPMAVLSARFAGSLIENPPLQLAVPTVVAALTMMGIALVAGYVPARCAVRVHPMDALRHS